ncbi:MAG: hypothetical protein ISR65_13295 [Bacteriovoracaceae bacterium]|nr:hypothetical protein [Bacteriovoracaceae bacterium]
MAKKKEDMASQATEGTDEFDVGTMIEDIEAEEFEDTGSQEAEDLQEDTDADLQTGDITPSEPIEDEDEEEEEEEEEEYTSTNTKSTTNISLKDKIAAEINKISALFSKSGKKSKDSDSDEDESTSVTKSSSFFSGLHDKMPEGLKESLNPLLKKFNINIKGKDASDDDEEEDEATGSITDVSGSKQIKSESDDDEEDENDSSSKGTKLFTLDALKDPKKRGKLIIIISIPAIIYFFLDEIFPPETPKPQKVTKRSKKTKAKKMKKAKKKITEKINKQKIDDDIKKRAKEEEAKQARIKKEMEHLKEQNRLAEERLKKAEEEKELAEKKAQELEQKRIADAAKLKEEQAKQVEQPAIQPAEQPKQPTSQSIAEQPVIQHTKRKLKYTAPPNYESLGRGLVYNCVGKHWACLSRESYFECRSNMRWSQENGKDPHCIVKNVYASINDCKTMQIHNINTVKSTSFCMSK